MSFTTITDDELVNMGVTGLPDTPELSTEAMQAQFDEYPRFLKDKFKTHITELQAETAASDIGMSIPESLTNVTTKKAQPIVNEIASRLATHTANTSNPHSVTKTQVGLGNVPNVTTDNQTPTVTEASEFANLATGDTLKTIVGKVKKAITTLSSHISNTSNPHSVTKSQVGLGNVDNTSDLNKPVSTATQTALDGKAPNNHASSNTTYGIGTDSAYGHVKLTDAYNPTTPGAAEDGIAASQKAVKDSYSAIQTALSGKAPTSHASANTDYGLGTDSAYGHVKLSDAYNPTTAGEASDGIAPSQKALKDCYESVLETIQQAGWGDMLRDVYDPDHDGVIAIEQGGTGASTVAGARNALGLGNTADELPVLNGGTGADNAADARTNLGAASQTDCDAKAEKDDLTNIDITGSTNSTEATITKDTFFYLNGVMVRAKADIASGATFTLNTNYEEVTAGGLNKLNTDLATIKSSLSNGLIGERITINGRTDNTGCILNIPITKTYYGAPWVTTNVSDSLGYPYSLTVTAFGTGSVSIRIRNMGDNSAITNTDVNFQALIFGLPA